MCQGTDDVQTDFPCFFPQNLRRAAATVKVVLSGATIVNGSPKASVPPRTTGVEACP